MYENVWNRKGRKRLNMGQEHEFFQSQGPKEDVCPVGPKEEAGRVTGTASAPALAPSVCLSCVFPGKESRHALCPGLRWGVSWSVEDGSLRGKSHLVTYAELVPLWPKVGFIVEGVRGEVSKIKCVEEKSKQFPPFPPKPKFLKCNTFFSQT